MTTPPEEEGSMFGEFLAAGAMFAFGLMLKRAVEVKDQGHHPPRSPRVVIDPAEANQGKTPDKRTVVPANAELLEMMKRASEGKPPREKRDVIDADEIDAP